MMFDFEIAFFLYKISKILAVFENNKYKSQAYYQAAMTVDSYNTYISALASQNKLTELDGIGKSSAKIIQEVLQTGECALLARLEAEYGIDSYSILLSHGLSDKTVKKLFGCGLTDYRALSSALRAGKLPDILTHSEREKIRQFVERYARADGRYLYAYAYCLGQELVELLNADGIAASLRLPWQEKVKKIRVTLLEDDLERAFQVISGSPRYVAAELAGGRVTCRARFGIPIEAVSARSMPRQGKQRSALRGDLHMHTVWSDGKHTIEQMAEYAKSLGHEYIGITDHSYSLHVANGISEMDARRQIEEIHALGSDGIHVLAGIEVEVLRDGSLDFSDAVLSQFDFVVAGIHTFLNQPPQELLARIEKALSNPYVSIFAHPTARLLGRPGVLFSERGPYSIAAEQIITLCAKYNVAIEFNAFPERFDIPTEYFCQIAESGVMVSVGTDSHSAAHLNCLQYAEIALRTCPKLRPHVINCLPYDGLRQFFAARRGEKHTDSAGQARAAAHDFRHFFCGNEGIMSGRDAVIGIDLTGSETKPSGWAVMRGSKVETAMLSSDDELIAASLRYSPKVVSIDSPLSLPEGRCCTDATCECAKYGITRYCERLLSAFGCGAYPCLIPSMVPLTTRGMRLAEKFRSRGVEVIESFPGVAQDILGIRRKQNGLSHLKGGYRSFGLTGDFYTSETIRHDELDAIASALVGMFYLNGQYVALGNDKEDYLIVPSVAEKPQKPIVLGLTGGISAGKTTLAEYLKFQFGFGVLRYSDIICKLYHCAYDRAVLQSLGAEIAADPLRQKELSLSIIAEIEKTPGRHYVVDGLRHQLDYDTLSQHFGDRFLMMYIDSTFTNTFRRYNKRRRPPLSKEEFQAVYNASSEHDIPLLMFTSQAVRVENNGTYQAYFDAVKEILRDFL